ncbi:hypothetical protein GOM49_11845 [Clostridium bovifaecis]|uniref:Uncharacterized protein n=1 Tax=Clostridium bovifaecis TaxID=2184719 RepID=A0A6I6EPW2_9CLOT|nr:hypothetical protein GOM49_11845 [Clostridium bovifaecis]
MNKKDVLEFLRENELDDVEEISSKKGLLVVRFFYDFDEDELEAARGYANDESEEDADEESWKEEYYLPYLNDIAADNVGEIIEEVVEEFDISGQYISYDLNEEERCEFIGVFSNEDFDIEEVLEELDL